MLRNLLLTTSHLSTLCRHCVHLLGVIIPVGEEAAAEEGCCGQGNVPGAGDHQGQVVVDGDQEGSRVETHLHQQVHTQPRHQAVPAQFW